MAIMEEFLHQSSDGTAGRICKGCDGEVTAAAMANGEMGGRAQQRRWRMGKWEDRHNNGDG
ncbi:hypothetical protein ACLOJK_006832 [Asimina triloba]